MPTLSDAIGTPVGRYWPRTPRPAAAPSIRSPAIRWPDEPGGRFGRRCDRQLGRHARAGLAPSLSAAGAPRPADRLLAVAVAVLVVVGARRGRRASPGAEPRASRPVLHRRLRHARRRLHLERHRRPRSRRAASSARARGRSRPGRSASCGPRASSSCKRCRACGAAAFNGFTIALGIASLAIVAVYPFMKRITYWPQIVLGLAFSWGALMGWAASFGRLDAAGAAALCRLDRLGDRLRHHLRASGSRGRCADRHQVDRAAVRRAHQADAGSVLRARRHSHRRGRLDRRRRRRLRRSAFSPLPRTSPGRSCASTSTIPTSASPCSSPTATPA